MDSNIPRLVFPPLLIPRLLRPSQKVIMYVVRPPLGQGRGLLPQLSPTDISSRELHARSPRPQVLLNAIAAAFLFPVYEYEHTMPSNKAPASLCYQLMIN